MIKFDTYSHKMMIDYFEKMILITSAILTLLMINQGPVILLSGIIGSFYMMYCLFDALHKIINPVAIFKNCWWEPGKE